MTFYAQNGMQRPIRLSAATRKFAHDSLNRKYGLDTLKTESVSLDDVNSFEAFSSIQKYDAAVQKIAAEAPIRICEGEKLSGAATLGLAILHAVPARYKGEPICASISHLTVDGFENLTHSPKNLIEL